MSWWHCHILDLLIGLFHQPPGQHRYFCSQKLFNPIFPTLPWPKRLCPTPKWRVKSNYLGIICWLTVICELSDLLVVREAFYSQSHMGRQCDTSSIASSKTGTQSKKSRHTFTLLGLPPPPPPLQNISLVFSTLCPSLKISNVVTKVKV